jgi:hypothetical protein
MNSPHFVHHHVARIDIDEELQGEVRRFVERVDRQVEQWAQNHPTEMPHSHRPPLILKDIDESDDAQK